MKLEIGSVQKFVYAGKIREVKIEKVESKGGRLLVTGFDYRADYPVGGYRSFYVENMKTLAIC